MEAAIDPGGDVVSRTPPTNQAVDDEGGGQAASAESEGEAPPPIEQVELEEMGQRRLSMQAAGGVAEEQEGEGAKPQEGAESADSEQVTTETDGEEGNQRLSGGRFIYKLHIETLFLFSVLRISR